MLILFIKISIHSTLPNKTAGLFFTLQCLHICLGSVNVKKIGKLCKRGNVTIFRFDMLHGTNSTDSRSQNKEAYSMPRGYKHPASVIYRKVIAAAICRSNVI